MHSKLKTIKYSGNIIFDSSSKDVKSLEIKIEKAFPNKLGFTSTTIIRSCDEIRSLIDRNPFKGIENTPQSRLNVTFLKTCLPAGRNSPVNEITFHILQKIKHINF